MTDIVLTDLTNSTDDIIGTGVFDILIQSVERHIEQQYSDGRITGSDYATVYLGSMQSVLSEAVKYVLTEQQADKQADLITEQVLSEQKKNETGGLIDLEKQKSQESIDLLIAQTATQYEQITASAQDTVRKNLLNSKNVIKVEKDTEYVVSQNSELLLTGPVERLFKGEQTIATTSQALDNTNKTNAEVALTNDRELEVVSSTIRSEAESTEKVLLLAAQSLGFKVDAKQKLMKQLYEGYAINTTTAGEIPAGAPAGATGTKLDLMANDILEDLDGVGAINI